MTVRCFDSSTRVAFSGGGFLTESSGSIHSHTMCDISGSPDAGTVLAHGLLWLQVHHHHRTGLSGGAAVHLWSVDFKMVCYIVYSVFVARSHVRLKLKNAQHLA